MRLKLRPLLTPTLVFALSVVSLTQGQPRLKSGMFADVVVFNPNTIADRATFDNPHQLAVGVQDVFVNGIQVLKDGEHTGAKPGKALWGPGKIK